MNAFDGLIDTLLMATDPASPFAVGTVFAVEANGSNPPVTTVTWKGAQVRATCLRHYTPSVGHVVLMARFGPQLIILGAC